MALLFFCFRWGGRRGRFRRVLRRTPGTFRWTEFCGWLPGAYKTGHCVGFIIAGRPTRRSARCSAWSATRGAGDGCDAVLFGLSLRWLTVLLTAHFWSMRWWYPQLKTNIDKTNYTKNTQIYRSMSVNIVTEAPSCKNEERNSEITVSRNVVYNLKWKQGTIKGCEI